MSKQVDERVVSMQFDNKHFEANVATTMSTLEKFKQKLNLSGATKSFNDVNAAAKKVDMSGLSAGIENVHAKFSALEVMGVTALANITNSAVNAGKRIVSALTIDPIKTGFQEYETQMNAVQTILANTQSKGSTLDDVNNALDTLNTYADKTIYNFTEMTRNIGTFTAAGVDLQTSVDSIQGIANLAAVSGSSSQQASTAMYQLSQALAAGKVSLMDWNSVVNAGMGGELFQNALIRTSELLKTGAKDAINTYGSFRESLTKGEWLTTEVLTETLKQISGAYSEADLIAQGYTKEQAKEIAKLAQTATDAATKVKTFSQLWDVMKESAQSGWAQTWKIIVGDFEEAKALLTPLADFFTNAIGKMSEARNALLEGVLDFSSPWTKITEKLNAAGLGKIKETLDTVNDATDKLKYFQDVVSDVWRGDYKNSDTGRFELLKKAGYNDDVVQDLVNKGADYKLTMKDVEESHKKFGLTMSKTTEQTKETTAQFTKLTNEQLKNAGLTESEIKLYNDLAEESERTGKSMDELIDKMSKTDGRTLLIDSLKNAGSGLIGIFTAIKNAWSEIFPAPSVVRIYNIIDAINQFSEKLRLTEKDSGELTDTAKKLQRTFEGIFAALDIVLTIIGGPLKIAFKAITQLLGMFDLNILDVTAGVGDAIVKFRDWIDSVLDFTGIFEKIIPPIKNAVKAVRDWFAGIKDAKDVPKYIADGIMTGFGKIGSFLSDTFGKIWDFITQGFSGAPGDMASGFINGVWNVIQTIGQTIMELGSQILAKFREVLGIHSPSTETFSDGQNFALGFIEGLKSLGGFVWDVISTFATKCLEILKEIDLGKVFAGVMSGGLLFFLVKLGKALDALTGPFDGVADVLQSTSKAIDTFSGVMKSVKKAVAAHALKQIAISIGILVVAIIALSFVPIANIGIAVGVIVVLAGVMVGLLAAINKLGGEGAEVKFAKFAALMLSMAGAIAIIAIAIRLLGGVDESDVGKISLLLGEIVGVMAAFMLITRFANGKSKWNPERFGDLMIKMAGAVVILAIVMKVLGSMSGEAIGKATFCLIELVGIMALLALIAKINGAKGADTAMKNMAISLGILAVSMRILGGISWEGLIKAEIGLLGLVGIMALLALVSKIGGKDVGKTMVQMTGAIGILAVTALILSGISWEGLIKAEAGLIALAGIMVGLVAATRLAGGNDLKGVGATLMAMSVAIGILAAVAVLLSLVSISGLAKGIIAIGLLSAIMSMMIIATKNAKDCKSNLIVMTVAIGVMAAAIVALSFIEPSKLAVAAGALGLLMGMFALMSKMAGRAKRAAASLVMVTVVVGVLAGILWLLSGLPVESTLSVAASLSTLLLAMATACAIVSKINVAAAAQGALGLSAFIGIMGALLAALGGLAQIPGLDWLIGEGSDLLSLIGSALGQFVGSIISGFGVGLTSGLPKMADHLSLFMIKLQPFILMAKMIDSSMFSGMKTLVEMILMLTAAELLNGITKRITGGSSLTDFAKQLAPFGRAMVNFSKIVEGKINKEAVDAAANAGKTLAAIATSLPKQPGGIATWFGESTMDMATFGSKLVPFGRALVNFSKVVDGKISEDAVKTAANAGKLMSDLANSLPKQPGVIASWFGESTMDMETFGGQMVKFGRAMVTFSKTLEGHAIDEGAIKIAANSGKVMANMASNLPSNPGAIASWFCDSTMDMETFGAQMVKFGRSVITFSKTVEGHDIDESAVNVAAKSGEIMSNMAKNLPSNPGGIASWFCDSTIDMETFGGQMVKFGRSIVSFSNAVKDGKVDDNAISVAANAGKLMSSLANDLPENPGWLASWFSSDNQISMEDFGKQLVEFGEAIVDFSDEVSAGVDAKSVNSVVEVAKKMISLTKESFGDTDFTEISDNLTKLGDAVIAFSDQITGQLDTEAITSASTVGKNLADMAKNMPAEVDLARITNGLDKFAESLVGFSDTLGNNINATSITTGVDAGKQIIEMLKKIPSSVDVTEFASGITALGDGLVSFSKDVSGDNAINKDSINTATDAAVGIIDLMNKMEGVIDPTDYIDNMTKLAKGIQGFYNVIEYLVTSQVTKEDVTDKFDTALTAGDGIVELMNKMEGYIDPTDYVNNMTKLAEGIKGFYNIIQYLVTTKITKDQVTEKFDTALTAGDGIVELMNKMEGYIDPTDYVNNMTKLAEGIKGFYNVVRYMTNSEISKETVTEKFAVALAAGNKIVELMNLMTNTNDITGYIENIPKLAEGIKGFYNIIRYMTNSEISSEDVTSKFAVVLAAGNKIVELMNLMTNTNDVSGYIENIVPLAKALVDFSITATGIYVDSVVTAGRVGKAIIALINALPDKDFSKFSSDLPALGTALTNFANGVSGVNSDNITTIIDGIDSMMDALKSMAEEGVKGFTDAFKNSTKTVKDAVTALVKAAVSGWNKDDYRTKFYNAGVYLVKGFAAGIKDSTYLAEAKAKAMANAAEKAAKEALDINSPSKVFRALGYSVPEGFAMGIDRMIGLVTGSSRSMADTAIDNVSSAISKVADYVNMGIDAQPTIRPVLDLSDVKSQAGSISGLFSMRPSVGVLSNVSAISSMMNSRQNGTTDDVISAIDGLRKSLGNTSGDQYNINGITYDDGSNVSEAVRSLVRAARIERRI